MEDMTEAGGVDAGEVSRSLSSTWLNEKDGVTEISANLK
jgi:hypothetical protein